MRFTTAIVTGLFAVLATAQSSGTPTQSQSPAQASASACLKKCAAGDVNCQSHCITVPNPSPSQVNATTECVAKCPQGNGTPAETQNYANCINACIAQDYYVSSEGTPQATGGSGSGSGSGSSPAASPTPSSGSSSGSSGSGSSGSGSGSGSSPAASPTPSSGSSSGSSGSSGSSPSGSSTATGSAATSTKTGAAAAMVVPHAAMLGGLAAIFAL